MYSYYLRDVQRFSISDLVYLGGFVFINKAKNPLKFYKFQKDIVLTSVGVSEKIKTPHRTAKRFSSIGKQTVDLS